MNPCSTSLHPVSNRLKHPLCAAECCYRLPHAAEYCSIHLHTGDAAGAAMCSCCYGILLIAATCDGMLLQAADIEGCCCVLLNTAAGC